jgi:ankyrin repeat protein
MWKIIAIAAGLAMVGVGGTQVMEQTVDGKTVSEVFTDPQAARLARAACSGKVEKVNDLIANGASPNVRGSHGMTPLFWALNCGTPTTVEALLKAGGNPNQSIETAESPLYRAATFKDPTYLRLMLKYGGDPNKPLSDGETVLSAAFAAGQYGNQWQNYYMLLDAGVDVNLPSRTIGMAEFAVAVGLPSKAVELLERGYNFQLESLADAIYGSGLNAVTAEHPQPLRDEAEYKYIGIAARMLKERGIDTEMIKRRIDEQDNQVKAGIRHDYSFEYSGTGRH